MTLTTEAAPPLVAAARDLWPLLDAAWPETEAGRRVPTRVVEEMRRAGLFRMFIPEELGGARVDLRTFVEVLETVARANSAASWDLAASSICTLVAVGLPREGIERLYGGGPDVILAGTVIQSAARAVADNGGYRVTGRWRFGSGCQDADYMIATALTFDGDAPRPAPNGPQEGRYVLFPRPSVTIHDTWNVIGLRGTGSHDWGVTDRYVPEHMTGATHLIAGPNPAHPRPWRGTLYRFPIASVVGLHFGSIATGLARRAIDTLTELAQAKIPLRSPGLLRERVQVQEAVARAEVALESARAYRAQAIDDAWRSVEAGEALSMAQRARIRLAGTNAAESAVRAVDLMYAAGGTTSIEDDFALSRCFRDVHVVAQHVTVLPLYYELVGRVFLGLELDGSRPF